MTPIDHFLRDIREHSEGRIWFLLVAVAAGVLLLTYA